MKIIGRNLLKIEQTSINMEKNAQLHQPKLGAMRMLCLGYGEPSVAHQMSTWCPYHFNT